MRVRTARPALTALFALALVAGACGGGVKPATLPSGTGSTPAPSATTPQPSGTEAASPPATSGAVDIIDNEYRPAEITIVVGARVVWTHKGTAFHTVTDDQGAFDSSPACPQDPSGCLMQGSTFPFTFTRAGVFRYQCKVHGSLMSGTVIVR